MGLVTLVSLLSQKMEISAIKRVKKILQRHFTCLSPNKLVWPRSGLVSAARPEDGKSFGETQTRVQPHPSPLGCGTLGALLGMCEPHFPHLHNGMDTDLAPCAVSHVLSMALAGLPAGHRVVAPRPCDSSSSHLLGAKPERHAVPEVDVTI